MQKSCVGWEGEGENGNIQIETSETQYNGITMDVTAWHLRRTRSWIVMIIEYVEELNTVYLLWACCLVFIRIFIGPESDHCLPLSLTNSLTHWLTHSCLVNLINGQVVTRHFLLGRCWHLGLTLGVDTYLNDIRFSRCQHPVSGVILRCWHLPKQYLLW